MKQNENILLQVNSEGMGFGDNALGQKLIVNYFKLSVEDNCLPKIVVFYNGGVKLLGATSPIVEYLKIAEANGVKLIACKTCLDFYGLTDKIEAGIAGTMMDIITLQKAASKVICL